MAKKRVAISTQRAARNGDAVLVLDHDNLKRVGILNDGFIQYRNGDTDLIYRVVGRILPGNGRIDSSALRSSTKRAK